MASNKRPFKRRSNIRTSWDPVAAWYVGWVGETGSQHHQQLAIPALLELLDVKPGENILDIGCGHGVLAPSIAAAGARYMGVDASEKLISFARRSHGSHGQFLVGDARRLYDLKGLREGAFDAVVFLLSIQDMDPLDVVLESATWTLGPGGRIVVLMTHPCFRVPRQSGWEWDEERKLQFRRVDRYLTPLPVPMKSYLGQQRGVTLSFHRPLHEYINGLSRHGLLTDQLREIPSRKKNTPGARAKAQNLADQEIPLFLGLRARKTSI